MPVWVNVWGRARDEGLRAASLTLLVVSLVGCIDDFDNPKGYGAEPGANGGTGGGGGLNVRPDCSDVCAESRRCSGGGELDCRDECAELESLARASGCERELDEVLKCLDRLTNVCTQQDACYPAVEDFSFCSGF
jgi:hypothetical protein